MPKSFKINFLDHVALRVSDLDQSVEWYQNVLGLKIYRSEIWGEFPVFLLAGKSGLALFPKKDQHFEAVNPNYDHFAFNVDGVNFITAQERLKELEIEYKFQDHHFFHSIYFKDPDDNTVELTTIVIDPNEFY